MLYLLLLQLMVVGQVVASQIQSSQCFTVSKYTFVDEKANFGDAEKHCRQAFNGVLVSPNTAAEYGFLLHYANQYLDINTDEFWLGVRRASNSKDPTNPLSFYFSDGTNIVQDGYASERRSSPWRWSNPNNDGNEPCVEVRGGLWNDRSCSKHLPFFCEVSCTLVDSPTISPTSFPITPSPTEFPTTSSPTEFPTTSSPTEFPTVFISPTEFPTTSSPTEFPTVFVAPTESPVTEILEETGAPTTQPTESTDTQFPSEAPTQIPTEQPTNVPTILATTMQPSTSPSSHPSFETTSSPSSSPTRSPTNNPLILVLPRVQIENDVYGFLGIAGTWVVMMTAVCCFSVMLVLCTAYIRGMLLEPILERMLQEERAEQQRLENDKLAAKKALTADAGPQSL